ncbi:hypothetical protein BC834DRAFT_967500 [Gloeopeniophorella convolvens]|nr:hypothetical protein BC834DRAFT_967500 [Gloeopeniophorella convolvens]
MDYGPGFGFGTASVSAGLRLALVLQMHTPVLPGINEIPLTAINLNDGEPYGDAPMDAIEHKPVSAPSVQQALQALHTALPALPASGHALAKLLCL